MKLTYTSPQLTPFDYRPDSVLCSSPFGGEGGTQGYNYDYDYEEMY